MCNIVFSLTLLPLPFFLLAVGFFKLTFAFFDIFQIALL